MTKKILIAGIVGGIIMFAWGAVSHTVLKLEESGIKQIPNEGSVLGTFRTTLKEPGFYFFPGVEESPNMTAEAKEASWKKWEQDYETGPAGILVYRPQGGKAMSPTQLMTELGSNIVLCILAAFLLSKALGSMTTLTSRVLFIGSMGLIASLAVDASYWNWYGFPTEYTLATTADQFIGFVLAGVGIGAILKPTA